MKYVQRPVRTILPLLLSLTLLSACFGRDQGPEAAIPDTVIVVPEVPASLLADVPHPVPQGTTAGDAAEVIERYRVTLIGVNDDRLALRRILNCYQGLADLPGEASSFEHTHCQTP